MPVTRRPYPLLLLLTVCIWGASCKNNTPDNDNEPPSADSAYFSIRQFTKDQIHTYYGMPFTLYRVSHMNGAVDSTIVSFFDMDWSSILGIFSATDISPRKYIGKYAFSVADDETTGDRGYSYTSIDPKAFTRLLQINTDPSNNRITSIYIETAKRDFWGNKTQKLLYVPMHIIQIQETEGNLLGKARSLRVDYRFMQTDEVEQF